MTVLLPILLAAVAVGLFVKQMTRPVWVALGFWIAMVIAYNFFKP